MILSHYFSWIQKKTNDLLFSFKKSRQFGLENFRETCYGPFIVHETFTNGRDVHGRCTGFFSV